MPAWVFIYYCEMWKKSGLAEQNEDAKKILKIELRKIYILSEG